MKGCFCISFFLSSLLPQFPSVLCFVMEIEKDTRDKAGLNFSPSELHDLLNQQAKSELKMWIIYEPTISNCLKFL